MAHQSTKKSFLVTTALEETWGVDEEVIFLGEWCKLYDRSHIWETRQNHTLTYNWDDRSQLYSDSEYLRDLYEKILPILSAKLNEIHGTSHTDRYWRILLGVWLGFFLQILFQRWSSITNATKIFQPTDTILLTDKVNCLIPNDMTDFVNKMVGDRWNHYICGRILQYQGEINCVYLYRDIDGEDANPNIEKSLGTLKNFLLNTWNSCMSPFVKSEDLFFISTYLPILDEIKLNLRFRQAPKLYKTAPVPQTISIDERRRWNLDSSCRTEFESFIREILPSQIPTAYLEGYKDLIKQSNSMGWPERPKLIFTSNSHIYDDLAKSWIASKVELGSSLVLGQHGGGSFHALNFQVEHEFDICDRYLSPGKGNTWHPKVIDVGQLFARKWESNSEGIGLLIQLGVPRYSYCITSLVQSDDFKHYLAAQMRFMALLPSSIQDSFLVRLRHDDYLWNLRERWSDRFPNQVIDDGKQKIHNLYARSKIIVCTYAATTFNETMAANAPTVIFWDPKYQQLHESSTPYFDELSRVGVFHETPESAAAHISMIWDNVDAWWESVDVQNIRKLYCHRYANGSAKVLENVGDALCKVLAEPGDKKL